MMGYAKNIKEMFEVIFTYDYSNPDEVDDQNLLESTFMKILIKLSWIMIVKFFGLI